MIKCVLPSVLVLFPFQKKKKKKKEFHSFHHHFITFLHVIEALGLDYINLYSVRQDWVLINIWEVESNRHLKMGVGSNVLMNNILIEWSMNVGGIQHLPRKQMSPRYSSAYIPSGALTSLEIKARVPSFPHSHFVGATLIYLQSLSFPPSFSWQTLACLP